jgi:hypothetical protein
VRATRELPLELELELEAPLPEANEVKVGALDIAQQSAILRAALNCAALVAMARQAAALVSGAGALCERCDGPVSNWRVYPRDYDDHKVAEALTVQLHRPPRERCEAYRHDAALGNMRVVRV